MATIEGLRAREFIGRIKPVNNLLTSRYMRDNMCHAKLW